MIFRSTPKTQSGGKNKHAHFKVALLGHINGRDVRHPHLLYIVHRDGNRPPWEYQTRGRGARYDYDTLQPEHGPPSHCPRNRRLQRESAAAERATQAEEQARSSRAYTADNPGMPAPGSGGYATGGYQSGHVQSGAGHSQSNHAGYSLSYNSGTPPEEEDTQRSPRDWYLDPSGTGLFRCFENGAWTDRYRYR